MSGGAGIEPTPRMLDCLSAWWERPWGAWMIDWWWKDDYQMYLWFAYQMERHEWLEPT